MKRKNPGRKEHRRLQSILTNKSYGKTDPFFWKRVKKRRDKKKRSKQNL